MKFWQYQGVAEPLTVSEPITVDKWYSPPAVPFWKKQVSQFIQTGNVVEEFITVDKWHSTASIPFWKKTAPQFIQSGNVVEEFITVDKWMGNLYPIFPKSWVKQPIQNPVVFFDPIKTEISKYDWRPQLKDDPVLPKRWQFLYPPFTIGEISDVPPIAVVRENVFVILSFAQNLQRQVDMGQTVYRKDFGFGSTTKLRVEL